MEFSPGETENCFIVLAVNDNNVEDDKTFSIVLSSDSLLITPPSQGAAITVTSEDSTYNS